MNAPRFVILLVLAALLAGCGNKGPLVLPDKDKADAAKAKVDPAAKQPEPPAHR